MAFTARTETYARGSSLTTPFNFTINKAGGVVDGDIMFMFLMTYVATPATVDSVPSGWTLIATNTAGNSRWYLYYKIASGEGTSYTWSLDKSTRYYALNIAYSSGDFDVAAIGDITAISNTLYGTGNTTVRAVSMNVPVVNSPLVYFAAIYNTTVRTFTKPSAPTTDWVEDADEGHTTPDISITNGSMIWAGSGATGDMDVICSVSITTEKHAFAIALKPSTPTITLTVSPAMHSHIAGAVTLIQLHNLSPANGLHELISSSPLLTEFKTLSVSNTIHAHITDNILLEVLSSTLLVVSDCSHGQVAGGVILVEYKTLVVSGTSHSHICENVNIIEYKILSVADADHTLISNAPVLIEQKLLVVDVGLHNHIVDSVLLEQFCLLSVGDCTHEHFTSTFGLLQFSLISPYDATHELYGDSVELSQTHILEVNDAGHDSFATTVSIIQFCTLYYIQDAYHTMESSEPVVQDYIPPKAKMHRFSKGVGWIDVNFNINILGTLPS